MAHPVLLLDDGELDDIQEMLEDAGITYARVRGGAIVPGQPAPTTLLVATPRRIDAVSKTSGAGATPPVRVVVVEEDSPTLRKRLREGGFDYIVRRPVHPEALRLLVLRCVYTGEERRRDPRVPVGLEIHFKAGLFRRTATLAELSARGCRLLSPNAIEPGKRLKLEIPQTLGASEPLWIRGRVLRMKFDELLGESGLYTAAVAFDELPANQRSELDAILEKRSEGPLSLEEGAADEHEIEETPERARPVRLNRGPREVVRGGALDPRSEEYERPPKEPPTVEIPIPPLLSDDPPRIGGEQELGEPPAQEVAEASQPGAPLRGDEAEVAGETSAADRRQATRRAFASKVPAFGSRALRVLVGRDLSAGGMRVERSPELEIGDHLHLAIYGDPDEEPMLVWATAVRDDGERGIGIVFDDLHPSLAEKLEKLVASLPSIESLHDDEAAAMGTVLSEILEQ